MVIGDNLRVEYSPVKESSSQEPCGARQIHDSRTLRKIRKKQKNDGNPSFKKSYLTNPLNKILVILFVYVFKDS